MDCSEFFSLIDTIFSIIKNTVTCVGTVVASTVAVLGLNAWRRQLKGKTEYEKATHVLVKVYEIRNTINRFRYTYIGEKDSTLLNNLNLLLGELELAVTEAEVVLGSEFKKNISQLSYQVARLQGAFSLYYGKEKLAESGKDLYWNTINANLDPQKDSYKNDLEEVIQSIEKKLKPYLK